MPSSTSSSPVSPAPSSAASPVPHAWTNLTVRELAPPRPTNGTVVNWAGGVLALAPDTADGPARVWTSPDARAWTELPPSTLGLDDPTENTLVNSASACGDGILVETVDGNAHVRLWSSTDASTWTQHPFHNESRGDLASVGGTVVANVDSGGGDPNGLALDVSTDCATWQRVALSGPKAGQINGLASNGSGFAAVGYSGDVNAAKSRPLAWWSGDGQHWSAASAPSTLGLGFEGVWAGSDGFLALATSHGATAQSLWTSKDGRSWAPLEDDPLGAIKRGAGKGSPTGTVAGDGAHLLLYGQPGISPADDSAAGTAQYWISTDGTTWSRPAIGGADAAAMLADQYPVPMVVRDGILFAGANATWLGIP